jgi:hypothetical protein
MSANDPMRTLDDRIQAFARAILKGLVFVPQLVRPKMLAEGERGRLSVLLQGPVDQGEWICFRKANTPT